MDLFTYRVIAHCDVHTYEMRLVARNARETTEEREAMRRFAELHYKRFPEASRLGL